MKKIGFYKYCIENFSIKMFGVFAAFIITVSSVFTIFFIYHQNKNITEDLTKRGVLLSSLLAYSSRTGVFAENRTLLEDAVHGIMNQKDVLSVSIFTTNMKAFLVEQKNPHQKKLMEMGDDRRREIMAKLTDHQSLEIIDSGKTIEFLRPIILETLANPEESLYFHNEDIGKTKTVIGYVNVILDKIVLNRAIQSTLINNTVIAIIFLFSGTIVVYLLLKRVTRPLATLTHAVTNLGIQGTAEKVTVKTRDEIGKLADAFNIMSENLREREREKRLLEEKLSHAQKMEAIGQFAGGIAHDFNNCLTAIMNYGHILKMKMKEGDPLSGYVEQMLAASKRAADLTQSLLTFGRKQIVSYKPVDLNNIVRNVEKILPRVIGEDIVFKSYLTDRRLTIMADKGQIEQVFMNLATNARDAMPHGGELTITTEPVEINSEYVRPAGYGSAGMYAIVSVADTGVGMDEKTRQKIFEPFFTTKGIGKGTGLGLSIVYGIIEQHKGYIDCYSEQGKGTTFMIYLPLADVDVEETEQIAFVGLLRGTEVVLVVDDNPDVREATKHVLKDFGYEVIAAKDGEDAIIKFTEHKDKIQLILLDVVMPKKNGKQVYEEIKEIMPEIKVLFTSGFTDDIITRNGFSGKELNFISKPASPMDLARKIREVLDK